jgi:excisionase family DNA binding protein
MSAKKVQAEEQLKPGSTPVDYVDPLTMSVDHAAKLLGISRASAYTYARAGVLPTVRLGTRLLVPKAAIEKLLASAQS